MADLMVLYLPHSKQVSAWLFHPLAGPKVCQWNYYVYYGTLRLDQS